MEMEKKDKQGKWPLLRNLKLKKGPVQKRYGKQGKGHTENELGKKLELRIRNELGIRHELYG